MKHTKLIRIAPSVYQTSIGPRHHMEFVVDGQSGEWQLYELRKDGSYCAIDIFKTRKAALEEIPQYYRRKCQTVVVESDNSRVNDRKVNDRKILRSIDFKTLLESIPMSKRDKGKLHKHIRSALHCEVSSLWGTDEVSTTLLNTIEAVKKLSEKALDNPALKQNLIDKCWLIYHDIQVNGKPDEHYMITDLPTDDRGYTYAGTEYRFKTDNHKHSYDGEGELVIESTGIGQATMVKSVSFEPIKKHKAPKSSLSKAKQKLINQCLNKWRGKTGYQQHNYQARDLDYTPKVKTVQNLVQTRVVNHQPAHIGAAIYSGYQQKIPSPQTATFEDFINKYSKGIAKPIESRSTDYGDNWRMESVDSFGRPIWVNH